MGTFTFEPGPFDFQELQLLHEMVSWWKLQKSATSPLSHRQMRPDLAGPSRNTGIRVNADLFKKAMAKAKKDRARTGGNFTGLIEFLLWQYLDFDPGLLLHEEAQKADT